MMRHRHLPEDPRVFVFGSNLKGVHAAGAAYYAYDRLGREWGSGVGLADNERSYALPTCSDVGRPLDLDGVRRFVVDFLACASKRQDLRFFVSEVGCGIAGFSRADVAPMFAAAPDNCDLPPGWREFAAIGGGAL